MRIPTRFFFAAVLSFALVLPAQAQRQSLSDRVTALEAHAAADQGNTELVNQIEQLRREVMQLRGMLEQLQNENEQLKQRNRDQYLDLDSRLNRLEGGETPATAPVSEGDQAAANPVPAPADSRPTVHGDVGALAQAGDERAAYDVAFDALKAGEYADSAKLFQGFLELYPGGVYAPNALYWLGESYYVTGNYQLASQQFGALLDRYPTHDKAAGALLKLGLCDYGLGKTAEAERILNDVMARYPGSDVARTADDRLRAIQVGRAGLR
ncbi:tol-pal system protein YbgF [Pseudoxanthomonas kalamensis DSM 18571]|uniref:tol-pal system protein YbgF n=1 Tax=Pseudoxanthomonas kalamensis TaxID=289483 RepID=UPI001391CFAD|nr:tol-pal system protein YbgF [Pseudoxanthomonas kalamensis]KAF1711106.1 tol-pal system protein YbgF [Pseudoxanthomonas kalamensis DSM 18571]